MRLTETKEFPLQISDNKIILFYLNYESSILTTMNTSLESDLILNLRSF